MNEGTRCACLCVEVAGCTALQIGFLMKAVRMCLLPEPRKENRKRTPSYLISLVVGATVSANKQFLIIGLFVFGHPSSVVAYPIPNTFLHVGFDEDCICVDFSVELRTMSSLRLGALQ